MIDWIPFDPYNPPETDNPFVVYSVDKKYLTFGVLMWVSGRKKWVEAANRNLFVREDVTHYAHINLPGEEEA